MEVTAIGFPTTIASTFSSIDLADIPFYNLPVTEQTKLEQEATIWELVQKTDMNLVVLARYMQILSDGFSAKFAGRCINIHHDNAVSYRPSPRVLESGTEIAAGCPSS